MLSHLTPPAIWKVVEMEEKHRDNLRLTKDTSIESPSEQLCATDAKLLCDTLTITGVKQEQQHNIEEQN